MMLEHRHIFVTGSHAGIGYAIAAACVAEGARVCVHARNADQARASAERLGASYVVGDLLESAGSAALVDAAAEAMGGFDGLVNNAAAMDRSTIDDLTTDHIDKMLSVNFSAPLMLIKAALPRLEARGGHGGAIVNVGSINAHCGAPNLLAYSASKGAMMTATRNLGDALGGRGVRVNQVNVGWTLTESEERLQRAEGQPEDWKDRLPKAFAPRGSILAPEEVAQHVAFWLSDKSAPATGQVYEMEQYPLIGRNQISER